jgi:hypothetical protein
MSQSVGLLIWIAYFLAPTGADGLVRGLPAGPVEAAALLMLAWLAAARVRVPGAPVVAAALTLTWISAAAIPGDHGFRARYFVNAAGQGAHERSIDFRDRAFTRIDRRLHFAPGGPEFPLPFFNDNSRFNFYQMGEPDRRRLEFAVRWSGMWWVDEERPVIYLTGPEATAEAFVDGLPVVRLALADGSPMVGDVTLTPGWHRLDVAFSSPYDTPRRFSAGLVRDGALVPFDGSMVVTQQIRDWQMTSARVLRRVKTGLDVLALAGLAWMFAGSLWGVCRACRRPAVNAVRYAQARSLFAVAAATEALIFAWPWARQNMVLIGGDDTMTYEGYARDILFNGLLMNGGEPFGQGEPFYYQAFYPYFLAATHAVFGESQFGPVLVQRLLAAFMAWKLVDIAAHFTTPRIWMVAVPIASSFVAWKFWAIAAQPLNESIYLPLLVATVAAMIVVSDRPTPGGAARAGVLGGFTAISRSTALPSLMLAWALCWLAWRPRATRTRLVVVMAAATLAVYSTVAVRNWIVAGQFSASPTGFAATFLGGNEIPAGLAIDLAPRAPFYQRFGITDPTAIVIEYALTAPMAFAQNLGRKALFALGFYEPYAPGWGYSPVYIAVWVTALGGLAVAARQHGSPAVWVPALIAVTQFVALVIVYPKGERLVLPVHTLLLPYSMVAAWWIVRETSAALKPPR